MNDIIAKVSPFLTQNARRPAVQKCFPRTGGETKRSPADRTATDLTLSDRLSAPHQNVSYLVLDAQRKVFPLPSHSRTPAAQPRLLSPVHAPGRTPLKLGHAHIKTLQNVPHVRRAYVGRRVLVSVRPQHAGCGIVSPISARQCSPRPELLIDPE